MPMTEYELPLADEEQSTLFLWLMEIRELCEALSLEERDALSNVPAWPFPLPAWAVAHEVNVVTYPSVAVTVRGRVHQAGDAAAWLEQLICIESKRSDKLDYLAGEAITEGPVVAHNQREFEPVLSCDHAVAFADVLHAAARDVQSRADA